jgi:hypothetical protein
MKVIVDSSNMVHKAFNAVLYQITNKIIFEEKLEKKEAKEKALDEINEDLVLHSVFTMFETTKKVLKSENKNYIFSFDNGSWRKDYLSEFNSKQQHEFNEKSYELKNISIEYKEGRDKTGRNIVYNVLKNLENLLNEIKINTININGIEADDTIAKIVKLLSNEDTIYVVSNDNDFFQLMKYKNVSLYNSSTKEIIKISVEEAEKYYKTKIMIEDSSDNISSIIPMFYDKEGNEIPGIRFGEETANKMVEEFVTFDKIIEELSNKIAKKHDDYYKKINVNRIKSQKWFGNSQSKDENNTPYILNYKSNNKHIEHKEELNEELKKEILNNPFSINLSTENVYEENGKYNFKFYLKIENPINEETIIDDNQIKNLILKSLNFEKIAKDKYNIENSDKNGINNILESFKNTTNSYTIFQKLDFLYSEFYNNAEEYLKNIKKYTKHDGIIKSIGSNKEFITFDINNLKSFEELDFNNEEKSNYSKQDIKNILNIYLNRNLIMMDFDYIPKIIEEEINETFKMLKTQDNILDNDSISKILEKYKLFSLSKKYKELDIDLYLN